MPATMKRWWSVEGAFVALVSIYIETSTRIRAAIGLREGRREGGASKTRDGEGRGGTRETGESTVEGME